MNFLHSSIRNIFSIDSVKLLQKPAVIHPSPTSYPGCGLDFHTFVSPLLMTTWKEFPCIPSFYQLWLVFWNLTIMHLGEVLLWRLIDSTLVWIFVSIPRVLNKTFIKQLCGFVSLCVCLERLADNHLCSLMSWHLLSEGKNPWAFQDVGQDCLLLAEFVWAGNTDIIVVNFHWKKQ